MEPETTKKRMLENDSSVEQEIVIVKNIIDLDTAKRWIKRWQDRKHMSDIISFRIPSADMIELIGKDGKQRDVRTYMAIKDDDFTTLLLVGVDEHGRDMIDFDKGEFIYDFTGPCPPLCNYDSPLMRKI